MSRNISYRLSEYFYYRLLPNGKIRAYNSLSGAMFETEPGPEIIWEILRKGKTLQELQNEVLKKHPQIFGKSSKALPNFIENCLEMKLIEASPS